MARRTQISLFATSLLFRMPRMCLVPSLGRALPLGLLLSVLFAPIYVSAADEPASNPIRPVITSALAIRKMSLRQAKQGYPVRLKGVITFYDPEQPDLFVQDPSSGIWIDTEIVKPNVPIRVGDLVEVEGVTEAPDFAPQVGNPRLRVLGHVSLPPARPVSFERMASTQEDSQRVEVEGIVHRVFRKGNHLLLEVAMEDGRVTGRIPFYTRADVPQIVDARVRLRGTCGAQFNSMNQLTGIFINIPYESEIQVIEPPPGDPFATSVRAISDLLRFSPQGAPGHRVQVHGVVTLFRPGKAIFIQNESGSLYAQTQQESPVLAPGDQVDVLGFVAMGRFAPELRDTIFRTAEKGQPDRFRIRLRPSKDVLVAQLPPWWNAKRAVALVALMVLGILMALRWGASLRRRVREATAVIRATLESTADGILVVDRRGRALTYNRKLQTMWGIPEENLQAADGVQALMVSAPQLKDPRAFLIRALQLLGDRDHATEDVIEFKDGRD